MKCSVDCFCHIASFEKLEFDAYQDSGGVWTIGYGHTKGVKKGDHVHYGQAGKFLVEDVESAEKALPNVKNLTQGNIDALTDFIFNVGASRFKSSTLYKKIMKNSKDPSIKDEFLRWVYCNHIKVEGLVRRRTWESERYYE